MVRRCRVAPSKLQLGFSSDMVSDGGDTATPYYVKGCVAWGNARKSGETGEEGAQDAWVKGWTDRSWSWRRNGGG
jgi:hypothetical protein